MGPVLPKMAVGFQQGFQRGRLIALPTAEQDHMMRAFDRIYTVHLHKSDARDQIGQGRTMRGPGGGFDQRMAVQKQAAGVNVCKAWVHRPSGSRSRQAVNSP